METTGKKVVSHVLIKWSSNECIEWIASNQVGKSVGSNYGRGKKRVVTSPLAAEARKMKEHRTETSLFQSRLNYRTLSKVDPSAAVERYMSQLRRNGIINMPTNSISYFLEYVSSLSNDSPQVLFEVLVNFYSSIVPAV
jgi:hypothetical protein